MKDLKITKGEWQFAHVTMNQYVHCDGKVICNVIKRFEQETKAVGELIADAGNTAQLCGLLPSELLKQRDELLEAAKGIAELLPLTPTQEEWTNACVKLESAITKIEAK